ncbi:Linear gramicidin synthase subunit D [Aquisphaera giovannonii]|uniref:Linear gramicidin synthase subunit D n=1 Tax=Aquisphaera giovannonii TaxID=406548 RepID=A0A5B9W8J8_9BACT|nr:non-ribosomal peptide synthetase [Aquisphaera giovannonii]QEH36903.1 Linear gramicidin synthase subunit D [Aquisphaera giovannonii]
MTTSSSADQKRRLLGKKLLGVGVELPVTRLFELQARKTPDAPAVVCEGRELSYRELDERANRLAALLRDNGVGPASLVGLLAARSVDLVAAMLGILKAGAAYVPLDPDFPADRLDHMVRDSAMRLIVTEDPLRQFVRTDGARVRTIDEIHGTPGGATSGRGPSPDDRAYVIYTSGSTGIPKGVEITHRSLTNFLFAMRGTFRMTADDHLLAVTTLSFDIAALEIFLPLIQGARVTLAGRATSSDGLALADEIEKGDYTFMQATPSTWRMLLDAGWEGSPGMAMLCGGEALSRELADRLLDKGESLWNLYGPTETTIWSSVARAGPGPSPISIGRPIRKTQFHALDARLEPVPPGVPGELFIGGVGLARGYLNRPGLTAERFLPDPFSGVPGARMYRTGDLVRGREDGDLECLGRLDHQVKVRGHRIELGEIEARLERHPAIRQAVVAAREGYGDSMRLVAYLVPADGWTLDPPALRKHLLQSLPEYMIPSAFVEMASLPLTPNGKVDRRALPDPGEDANGVTSASVPPRGPVEEGIAEIWRAVLHRDRIGAEDDFFEAGGHSLLATQALARVRDVFDVELTVRDLLDGPTVAGLARRVDARIREGRGQATTPIQRDATADFPASSAQRRLWFLHQLDPVSPAYNMPANVTLHGDLDREALQAALEEIVRRHEVLRATFRDDGGEPRPVVGEMGLVELPMVDLRSLPADIRADEQRRLVDEEAARPFDLARGPLLRVALLQTGDREHVLLVTVHHIVTDGWSMGILVREACLLYDAFAAGRPSPLPELPIQYTDYARWQRDWLASGAEAQLAYWVEELRGVPPLDLPADRARPSTPSGRGGSRSIHVPAALLDDLKALGRREHATLYMTLMTAFQVLLSRYANQHDFAVGTPIAGRTRSEVEPLIGLFVNTLAIRARLDGDPSFLEALRRVRQSALAAYAHQDLPFDRIVAAIEPGRNASRSPVFQALFALQDAPRPDFASRSLSVSALESPNPAAKFDLALFAAETDRGLGLELQYSTDLFDAETAEQILDSLAVLLEGISDDPGRSIGALPIVSDADRDRALGTPPQPAIDLDALTDEEVEALLNRLEP